MTFLNKPQRVWWRKLLFQIHLWTGIGLGLYIFVVSVSGAALVFQSEIQLASEKRIVTGEQGELLGFDGLKRAVESKYPDHHISWLRNRENPREAVEVWLERGGERQIMLADPVTGEILGRKGDTVGVVLQWLADLHIHLLGATSA